MYHALVFFVLLVVVSAEDEIMRKCHRLLRPDTLLCCTDVSKMEADMVPDMEAVKECLELKVKPPSCEREECIAKNKGYFSEAGGMDIKAFTAIVEKDMKNKDLLAKIKEKCLEGDISKYGPPDMCDFSKMRHCIHMAFVMACPEWSDKGECSGIKPLLEDCNKLQ